MNSAHSADVAGDASADVAPFKGPLRVRGARQRLASLEALIDDRERRGHDLCEEFKRQYPNAPAKVVRYNDRTLTYFRWRRSSARKWRHQSGKTQRPRVNPTLTLTSDDGRALLAGLPVPVQRDWLAYERQRLALNLEIATAEYERRRLAEYIEATRYLAAAKPVE
ncbi:hypothetical protein [Salinisphaera orenii]|uniref:hypothetical protein n=1 Tax=Salinisphaera orenii TaxID=856731 RepID=UPI0013A6296C